jgi:hypothetical protein
MGRKLSNLSCYLAFAHVWTWNTRFETWQECTNYNTLKVTGQCKKNGDLRAEFAYIYYNVVDYPSDLSTNQVWRAHHELGHVFGLAHVLESEGYSSVMKVLDKSATWLQSHEIGDINGWY